MSAVFGCVTGPGERRDGNLVAAVPAPARTLSLTLGETRALLILANAGRAALDADPRLLNSPQQREAARRAVSRLRTLAQP